MQSPTLTSPSMTAAGLILGTAAYMSPEQAKGRPADRRSDIWAFGCVLYEMLSGRRAFAGDDVSETLASVLRSEPDWRLIPHDTPDAVRRVLRRCLEKDPKQRYHAIADAKLDLADAADDDRSSRDGRRRPDAEGTCGLGRARRRPRGRRLVRDTPRARAAAAQRCVSRLPHLMGDFSAHSAASAPGSAAPRSRQTGDSSPSSRPTPRHVRASGCGRWMERPRAPSPTRLRQRRRSGRRIPAARLLRRRQAEDCRCDQWGDPRDRGRRAGAWRLVGPRQHHHLQRRQSGVARARLVGWRSGHGNRPGHGRAARRGCVAQLPARRPTLHLLGARALLAGEHHARVDRRGIRSAPARAERRRSSSSNRACCCFHAAIACCSRLSICSGSRSRATRSR